MDADSGSNAQITYSVEPGSNSTIVDSWFGIDDNSGKVRLIAAMTSGDVNASYVVTVRATDAGTQPLSTSVRLCATVVDRNVSEYHLRSAPRRRMAIGSLVLDATMIAALVGGSMLCAFAVIVVSVVVAVRRCARARRHRQMNRCKNPSHYKLVDVWNGTYDDERTEKRQSVNGDDDEERSSGVPRTVIRTLDRSPRSSRNADVGIRRSCGSASMWRGNLPSTLKRHEPEGCINLNHFDVEASHIGGSSV